MNQNDSVLARDRYLDFSLLFVMVKLDYKYDLSNKNIAYDAYSYGFRHKPYNGFKFAILL